MRKLILAACLALIMPMLGAQERLPMDDAIATGELPNGLKYVLLPSWRSGSKINFYLVNMVGSCLEEEDERGFSHFVEHMAFNGTRNFPGNSIQEILEANGLKFGADFNAYTSQDYTVYSICDVPSATADSTGMYLTCLEMLRDISAYATIADEDVERERKIIIEEWRHTQNASARIRAQMGEILFGPDSPYTRLPIGTYHSLSALTPEQLRTYYRHWYQPQHQTLIVIGDIAIGQMIIDIQQPWKDINLPKMPSVREWAQIPEHQGLKAGAIADPELAGNQLEIWFKLHEPPRCDRDLASYVQESLVGHLASSILAQRLKDILYEENAPFTNAQAEIDDYYGADSKDAFRIRANYDRARRRDALERMVEETKRIVMHGVTAAELQEVKDAMRKSAESTAQRSVELNNYKQWKRVSEYVLKGNVVMSPMMQKRVFQTFADTVTAETVNAFLRESLALDNAVAVMAEKGVKDGNMPDSCALRQWIIQTWEEASPQAYVSDDSRTRPLIAHEIVPGKIINVDVDSVFEARTYTLSNGARVIAAFKDLRSDQIDMRAVRPGGITAFADSGFAESQYAALALEVSGLGAFSAAQLARRLTGINADIELNHYPYSEMVQASSSVQDMETMLQLMHLRMTTFRRDSVAFANWRRIRMGQLNDLANDPGRIFSDSIRSIMYGHNHPYLRQITLADIDTLDYEQAMRLGESRLRNPAGYDFIITGNLDFEALEPLLEKYIGSLPQRDSIPFPEVRAVSRTMRPGHRRSRFSVAAQQTVTRVYMAFEIRTPFSVQQQMCLQMLRDIWERALIESLRTRHGATYSPQVGCDAGEVDGYLSLFLSFDTNAEMAEPMAAEAVAALQDIAVHGPAPNAFEQAKEYLSDDERTDILQQQFPLQHFSHLSIYGCDHMLHKYEAVRRVTLHDVRQLAQDFVNAPATVQIIMDAN